MIVDRPASTRKAFCRLLLPSGRPQRGQPARLARYQVGNVRCICWCIGRCIKVMPRMMVQIDDQLLEEAKRLTGARTKRAAIETALQELVRRHKAAGLAKMAGKVPISLTQRDLRAMREGRLD